MSRENVEVVRRFCLVGLMQVHGRGKASGVEIDPEIAALFHLHDGRVTRLETLMDPAEALRSVGLGE